MPKNTAQVKHVKRAAGKPAARDKSMHGGIRGGDPDAAKDPNENREAPIIQRTP